MNPLLTSGAVARNIWAVENQTCTSSGGPSTLELLLAVKKSEPNRKGTGQTATISTSRVTLTEIRDIRRANKVEFVRPPDKPFRSRQSHA